MHVYLYHHLFLATSLSFEPLRLSWQAALLRVSVSVGARLPQHVLMHMHSSASEDWVSFLPLECEPEHQVTKSAYSGLATVPGGWRRNTYLMCARTTDYKNIRVNSRNADTARQELLKTPSRMFWCWNEEAHCHHWGSSWNTLYISCSCLHLLQMYIINNVHF